MVSLYEILEVPPTATKDEIKKAYKSMALKTHPDRVPPEQKVQAEEKFQKVSAAYEVLSNDNARREYDLTGRIPSNAALGTSPPTSSTSRNQGHVPPFVNPFPFQPFGFGDGFFQDRFNTFNSPFFAQARTGMWDPFENDPFFNPMAGGRRGQPSPQNMFRDMDDIIQQLMSNTGPGTSGGRMHGNSLFDPPPFPFAPSPFPQRALPRNNTGDNNSRRSESRSFAFSSSSTFKDGRWTTESYEESNINGERRARREWIDNAGVRHREDVRLDGTSRYLRNGVDQPGALPPPPSYQSSERDQLISDAPRSSFSRRLHRRDRD